MRFPSSLLLGDALLPLALLLEDEWSEAWRRGSKLFTAQCHREPQLKIEGEGWWRRHPKQPWLAKVSSDPGDLASGGEHFSSHYHKQEGKTHSAAPAAAAGLVPAPRMCLKLCKRKGECQASACKVRASQGFPLLCLQEL